MPAERSSSRRRPSDPVLRKIDAVRRALVLWAVGWGYLWAALLVAAMIFAGVLADHWFVLQKGGRLAFFCAFTWSAAGVALFATLFPLLRRTGRLYVARRMEMRAPGLKNGLITYLQCRGDPGTPRELKRLMRRRAAPQIEPLDATVAVEPIRYVRLGAAVASVVAAFALYALFSPKSAGASVRRLLQPRADILPPTATRLTRIEPGDLYVVAGGEPRIAATVAGVRPEGVCAVWDGTSFAGRRVLLAPREARRWEGAFPPLLEDGGYHLAAGDTRSDRFVIKVLPTPAVAGVRLTLTPPAYTGLPAQVLDDGSADVIYGTEVALEATTNLPAQAGYLQFGVGRRLWMQPAPGGSALRARFPVRRSDSYSIHFETAPYPNGATFENPSPVRYQLTCRQDQPPAVKLLAPPDGLRADPSDTVTLRYAARDDFGLTQIRLHYRTNDLPGPVRTVAEPGVRAVPQGAYEWDLGTVPLRPGLVVTYCLEAADNRPDAPQAARSEERRIVMPPRAAREAEQGDAVAVRRAGPAAPPDAPDAGRPPAADAALPRNEGMADGRPDAGRTSGEEAGTLAERARRIVRALDGRSAAAETEDEARREAGGRRFVASGPPPATARDDEGTTDRPEGQRERDGQAADGQQGAAAGGAQGQDGAGSPEAGQAQAGASGEPGQGAAAGGAQDQGGAGSPEAGQAQAGASGEPGPGAAAGGAQDQGGAGSPEAGQAQAGASGEPGQGAAAGGAQDQGGAGSSEAGQAQAGASGEPGPGAAAGGAQDQGGAGSLEAGQAQAGASGEPGPGAAAGAPQAGSRAAGSGGSVGAGVNALPAPGPPEGRLSQADLDSAMEEVARMVEEDDLPGGLLKDVGMDREQLGQFVERYRAARRQEEAGLRADGTAERGRVVESPTAAAEGTRAVDALPEEPARDALQSRFDGASERLAPRYRDVVQQYYKTLSEAQ